MPIQSRGLTPQLTVSRPTVSIRLQSAPHAGGMLFVTHRPQLSCRPRPVVKRRTGRETRTVAHTGSIFTDNGPQPGVTRRCPHTRPTWHSQRLFCGRPWPQAARFLPPDPARGAGDRWTGDRRAPLNHAAYQQVCIETGIRQSSSPMARSVLLSRRKKVPRSLY